MRNSSSSRRSTLLVIMTALLLATLTPGTALAVQGPDTPEGPPPPSGAVGLEAIGRYQAVGAEISAFDPASRRVFVTAAADASTGDPVGLLQILDISDPAAPALVATDAVVPIFPLGLKDHNRGVIDLQEFPFDNLPPLGVTPAGQTINLGGFSGLWFVGMNTANGAYQFVTVPDRGPNGAPTDVDGDGQNERPFALPNYQARVVSFEVDSVTGEITITGQQMLTRSDGATPITGLPNIPGVDEEPVDLFGVALPYDELGADLEGIVVAPDGSYWMVDEYRPAIYHFAASGALIDRFVPEGTAALAGQPAGTFGSETSAGRVLDARPEPRLRGHGAG